MNTYHRFGLLIAILVTGAGAPSSCGEDIPIEIRQPITLTDAALALHRASIVVDGHNDLPWALCARGGGFEACDIARPQDELDTDIPRLREGGVGAQFWSVFVPVDTMKTGAALSTTIEQIELVNEMVATYPEEFEIALSTADIRRIRAEGKIASLIGVEGGHSIENSLSVLRKLYELGARYMTLTHSATLDWADSCTDEPRHGGLAKFGEEVVAEMNALGMLVDLSHVSPDCMRDALRIAKAPVIFSHSSARAIADHPRNVPDDILQLMAKNGGVVMINFYTGYLEPRAAARSAEYYRLRAEWRKEFQDDEQRQRAEAKKWEVKNPAGQSTVHDVLDHIDHIAKVAGIDHVGLGSDFDGVPTLPVQLDDVAGYPYITQGLLDRGYSEEDIKKVLGENLMCAFAEAERVARE